MSASYLHNASITLRQCRRVFPRYQFHTDVEIIWESAARWGRVSNISRGGMFIETSEAPPLGVYVPVYLALNVPLRLDCLVRRVVPGRGFAVSMTVPEDEKVRFEALLVALARASDPASEAMAIPRVEPPCVEPVRVRVASVAAKV